MTPTKPTTATDLAEIQKLTVVDMGEFLGDMSREDLQALRALEVENGNRVTALAAIDARVAELDNAPPAAAAADESADAPDQRFVKSNPGNAGKDIPDWQKPDYTGKLDGGQAEWRRHNIKPVNAVTTK